MMPPPISQLAITVYPQEQRGIALSGRLTYQDVKALTDLLQHMMRDCEGQDIDLDLAGLEDMDYSALRALMQLHDAAKRQHSVLTFKAPQGKVEDKIGRAAKVNHLRIVS